MRHLNSHTAHEDPKRQGEVLIPTAIDGLEIHCFKGEMTLQFEGEPMFTVLLSDQSWAKMKDVAEMADTPKEGDDGTDSEDEGEADVDDADEDDGEDVDDASEEDGGET